MKRPISYLLLSLGVFLFLWKLTSLDDFLSKAYDIHSTIQWEMVDETQVIMLNSSKVPDICLHIET